MVSRKSEAIWDGDLVRGRGTVTFGSGALPPSGVTWAGRTGAAEGETSPEELLAGAQASCYAMALSAALARRRTPPQQLVVDAECFLEREESGFKVTLMKIAVKGRVEGIEPGEFELAAREAEAGCPISNAIRNNVEIELAVSLA